MKEDISMQLLLIICGKSRNEEVTGLFEKHEIHGYTEVPTVIGSGLSGRHMGTRTAPGTECMLFTLLAKERVAGLMRELKDLHSRLYAGEALSVFSLDAERVL
jgi:hypothetical protein